MEQLNWSEILQTDSAAVLAAAIPVLDQALSALVATKSPLDNDELCAVAAYLVEPVLAGNESLDWFDRRDFERTYRYPDSYIARQMANIWEPPPPPLAPPSGILFSKRAPWLDEKNEEWGLRMTSGFRKCIKELDKNLRGRMLDAISDISEHPMELRGDTIKPLTGELKGFWRYRVGDYRLVYFPDPSARRVDLVSVGGRGGIYA